jgi:hypothetical protein
MFGDLNLNPNKAASCIFSYRLQRNTLIQLTFAVGATFRPAVHLEEEIFENFLLVFLYSA